MFITPFCPCARFPPPPRRRVYDDICATQIQMRDPIFEAWDDTFVWHEILQVCLPIGPHPEEPSFFLLRFDVRWVTGYRWTGWRVLLRRQMAQYIPPPPSGVTSHQRSRRLLHSAPSLPGERRAPPAEPGGPACWAGALGGVQRPGCGF